MSTQHTPDAPTVHELQAQVDALLTALRGIIESARPVTAAMGGVRHYAVDVEQYQAARAAIAACEVQP